MIESSANTFIRNIIPSTETKATPREDPSVVLEVTGWKGGGALDAGYWLRALVASNRINVGGKPD